MTQPHLLEFSEQVELAKQGDPHAIATLMNVTLEPQGITAKAFVEVDCLSVFLSAARPLNAEVLVAFVQRGIFRLEVLGIQQVQVYGQQPGEEQPAWVETFVVARSQAEVGEAPSENSNAHASKPNVSDFNVSDFNASKPAVTHLASRTTRLEAWMQQWALKPFQASLTSIATLKHTVRLLWRDRCFEAASQEAPNSLPSKNRINYLKLSAFVTLAAFFTGGAVALIANSYTLGSAERTHGKLSAIATKSLSIPSDTERRRNQQQTAAKNYLETMNKAQQAFYRENKRFAATLEELERFAAAPIAVRSDYTYKLTVPNSLQSQLTAIPRADGLKSYTAAASIAKPTNRVVTAICASQQSAKVPPLVFQSPDGAVQCPVESAKAS